MSVGGKASGKQAEYLNELKQKPLKRVLFVCLGNICRSPAAEGIMRRVVEENNDGDRWIIDSGGMGGWHVGELPDKRMRVHANRRGYDLVHHCRKVKESDFDDFDLIIGMDDSNISDLRRLAPTVEAASKIFPMALFVDRDFYCDHIPDPYYSGAEGFERVLDLLENGCANLFEQLR